MYLALSIIIILMLIEVNIAIIYKRSSNIVIDLTTRAKATEQLVWDL